MKWARDMHVGGPVACKRDTRERVGGSEWACCMQITTPTLPDALLHAGFGLGPSGPISVLTDEKRAPRGAIGVFFPAGNTKWSGRGM